MRTTTKIIMAAIMVLTGMASQAADGYGWFTQSSYRGFVEFDGMMQLGDDTEFSGTATTSHGWQVSKNWFAGAGIGYNFFDSESSLPIFVQGRFELPDILSHGITPFADAKTGVSIGLSGNDSGLFQSQTIGCRFKLGHGSCGISPGVGFTCMPNYNFLHLSVALDF